MARATKKPAATPSPPEEEDHGTTAKAEATPAKATKGRAKKASPPVEVAVEPPAEDNAIFTEEDLAALEKAGDIPAPEDDGDLSEEEEAAWAAIAAEAEAEPGPVISFEEVGAELSGLNPGEEQALATEFGDHWFDELSDTDIDDFLSSDIGVDLLALQDAALTEPEDKLSVLPPVGHPEFGNWLGDAEFVGQYEDGSPEWHEARTKGIGGSDAASILGIGFTSAYVLWMKKKGFFGEEVVSDGMAEIFWWGHAHEDAIAARFLRGHDEFGAFEGGSWRKADATHMLANPDRILRNKETGELSILEIKSSEQGKGWENDRCPAKYVVQLRHYMWVFGIAYGYLCVKIGNSEYLEFMVPANVEEDIVKTDGGRVGPSSFKIHYGDGAYLQEAESNFLALEEPPAMDGNKDIYEFVRSQNMSLDRGTEVELPVDVGSKLVAAVQALKKAEADEQESRNHVMAHMGCAQYATYNGDRVASRVAQGAKAPYLKVT